MKPESAPGGFAGADDGARQDTSGAGDARKSARYQRIVVLGTTGSGKTTFAAALAERLGVKHVELDALHWDPGWAMAEREVFRRRVAAAVVDESWVVDGNYGKARDLVWPRAEAIVWLDYPFALVFARLLRRTLGRVVRRTELWNGNREELALMLSRDSILLWAFRSHWRHRREYAALLARPEFAHLDVLRFRSPRAAEAWLRSQ